MLSYYERNIDYLELELKSIPTKGNVRFRLNEHIIPHLKKAAEEKTAVFSTKNKTASLHVHSVDVDDVNEIAVILFHYTDTNLTDPAFKNMTSGSVRIAGKSKGEGIAVSAHLVVDLNHFKGQRASVHLALLEVVPGISKSLIERALTSLFNKTISRPKWTFKPSGEEKSKSCRPSFRLNNLASESLSEGLKARRLTGVTLVNKKSEDDFDEDDLITKETQVSYAIGANVKEEAAEQLLYRLSRKAKDKGYSTLKVQYDDEYRGTRTGKFNSLEEEAIKRAAGVFSKRGKVYTENQIHQCQESQHSQLVRKIKSLMCKECGVEYVESNNEEVTEATLLPQN
ncbi:hypothetical protein [Vibrio vulnificus]|uniref:hypothetical protein n=1 Tax=Vibrio vulnificus TaxID=672 RepID=UPI003EDADC4C